MCEDPDKIGDPPIIDYTQRYSLLRLSILLHPLFGANAMFRMNSSSWLKFSAFGPPASRTLAGVFSSIAVGLAIAVTGPSPTSSAAEREVMSPTEIEQIGMVQAWRRHLSVPAGAQSIVDHAIHVRGKSPKQYVEVVSPAAAAQPAVAKPNGNDKPAASTETKAPKQTVYARYLLEVPDPPAGETSLTSTAPSSDDSMLDRLSLSGKVSFASSGLLDRAEAERLSRNDIRRLKRREIDAEIQSREVPVIHMLTLSNDGTVECRDAETGEIVWLRRVGDRVRGYSGLGVNDSFVSVINGGELIILDAVNGEEHSTERLQYIPTGGPRHCGGYAIVPSVGDRMVAYPLENEFRDVFARIVNGGCLAPPSLAVGSERIAWGSSGGFVYVMEASGEPTIDFRLDTDGIVGSAPAAAAGDRFFFGAASGQIYGLRATRVGEVLWTRPTGDPIFDSAVVFDDRVLFRSSYGNLMCVDAATGLDVWPRLVGGIAEVIGVVDDQVFARTLGGSMVILNADKGEIAHQLLEINPRVLQTNIASDRLYLVDKMGNVQCLRRPDAEMPTLTVAIEKSPEEKPKDDDKNKKKEKKPASDEPSEADPFGGGGADPFGGGGADPFGGGGADPFAPTGGGNEDDPFGF
jgi:hypothetical protein